MRKRTLIRTSLVLGSLCMTAWQFPSLMERFDLIMAGRGLGLPSTARATEPPAQSGRPVQPGEIVVFSPDGRELSAQEVEALKKRAAAGAPINSVRTAPATSRKPGEPADKPAIGEPNPEVLELLKQIEELRRRESGGSR
ncbi:MAG: hypothetical protein IBJ10_04155 [Phycisphaerales bacterium]|nr:hypothetical protein [Phycisphaerales bacterium]